MAIKNNEWYYNRIIWKANKCDLFNLNCTEFSILEKNKQKCIIEKIPKDIIPVIVFWDSCNRWTVLSIDFLISYYNNELIISSLDIVKADVAACVAKKYIEPRVFSTEDMAKLIANNGKSEKYIPPKDEDNVKLSAKWLYLKNTDEYIWLPGVKEVFCLWGIMLDLSRVR